MNPLSIECDVHFNKCGRGRAGVRGSGGRGGDGPAEAARQDPGAEDGPHRHHGAARQTEHPGRRGPGAGRGGRGDDLRGDDRFDGRQGLLDHPGGKTPAATLYSAILMETRTKGTQSRFTKTSAASSVWPCATQRVARPTTARRGPRTAEASHRGARAIPCRPVASWANVGEPAAPPEGPADGLDGRHGAPAGALPGFIVKAERRATARVVPRPVHMEPAENDQP